MVYFLKLRIGVYLRAKFQVSSIILTSFRQGVILPPPPQNEPLKSPSRVGGLKLIKSSALTAKFTVLLLTSPLKLLNLSLSFFVDALISIQFGVSISTGVMSGKVVFCSWGVLLVLVPSFTKKRFKILLCLFVN